VTFPDPHDPPEEQATRLRFLNHALLRNLAVHEGYPGHYLHTDLLRRVPSPARKAVHSAAFSEGWAHYAEMLMLERGYREDDPAFHLATLQSALRRAGRFRVAVGLHADGWSVDEAARFLEGNCYLEPGIARAEAARGVFDPLYLVYTLGRLEIERLRKDLEQAEGERFSLSRFHHRLLALGAPPLPLARIVFLGHDVGRRDYLD
jgi:uncharacterized protein (DUF885 family)